ncbi:MAG TPA: hypothetical protein VF013_11080 [Candidatus Limnocylindria bacterium]
MTTKLAAALAAAALAVGILVGAAGTVLVHDATRPTMGMAGMAGMHQMMNGGTGPMMDGPMGPGASMDPSLHRSHHGGDR